MFQLIQNNNVIYSSDHPEDVREKIEELLEEKIGFFVMLQENADDMEEDGYRIYLHTDNEEDLTDEDFDTLTQQYNLDCWNDDNSNRIIRELLNIDVKEVV